MCFTTKLGQSAVITDQDITAFKVLTKEKNELSSPFRRMKWKLGGTKKVTKFTSNPLGRSVYHGIHCYKSLPALIRDWDGAGKRGNCYQIYLITIPKGTMVHINDTEYCAEKVTLENLAPIRIKSKKK